MYESERKREPGAPLPDLSASYALTTKPPPPHFIPLLANEEREGRTGAGLRKGQRGRVGAGSIMNERELERQWDFRGRSRSVYKYCIYI